MREKRERQSDCFLQCHFQWQCRPENGRKWKWLAVKIGVPGKCHLEAYAVLGKQKTGEANKGSRD